MREILSIFLVVILCGNVTYAATSTVASAGLPSQVGQKPTLQEKLLEIRPGSRVNVRLKNKERLRGQLGEVSNDGFVLKYAQGNEIKERKIGFDEVKSIKVREGGRAGRVVVYVLAGAGLFFLVFMIILLTVPFDS